MTAEESWAEVDRYICELFVPPDAGLDSALEVSRAADLPAIQVAPNQGKLLHLLARAVGARQVLEIGTLGGYSTIWLARALPPDGSLVTLEIDRRHAELARSNLEAAGVSEQVELVLGPAVESLAALAVRGAGPFDLVFIDADKEHNVEYFEWALQLTRAGSLIVVDNVVRHGAVVDAASTAPDVVGTRRLNEVMAGESRVSVTELQTVGSKGHDGFALALVLPD